MNKWNRILRFLGMEKNLEKSPENAHKEEPAVETAAQADIRQEPDDSPFHKMHFESLNSPESTACRRICCKIFSVMLCIFTVVTCIAVIAVTVTGAIASKMYSTEVAVAMVVLTVTAAVTLAISIYSNVAVFKRHRKPLHASAVVLVVITVIQIIILLMTVRVSDEDELNILRSLTDSFKMNLEHNPRHVNLWATTQHDLSCCGIDGPDDYRSSNLQPYFAPDVPISCCSSYDPDRSDLVQERERQICRATKVYYLDGCKNAVLEVFYEISVMVTTAVIFLIVLQVLSAITTASLCRYIIKNVKSDEENASPTEKL